MTRREKELAKKHKREKRNKVIMSVILAMLMFGSIFGIWASSSSSEKIILNGYKFKIVYDNDLENYMYTTKFNDRMVYFYSRPDVASSIEVDGNLTEFFNDALQIVFTNNVDEKISYISDFLRYDLSSQGQKNMVGAVDDIYEGYEDRLIMNCENSSSLIPVIYLKEVNNYTNITIQDNCLLIDLNAKDTIYVRDRMLLSLLGIINE